MGRRFERASQAMHLSFPMRKSHRGPGWRLWAGICGAACMGALLSGVSSAQDIRTAPSTGAGYHPERDTSVTAVNQRPDANRVQEINAKRVRTQRFDAANAERKRQ